MSAQRNRKTKAGAGNSVDCERCDERDKETGIRDCYLACARPTVCRSADRRTAGGDREEAGEWKLARLLDFGRQLPRIMEKYARKVAEGLKVLGPRGGIHAARGFRDLLEGGTVGVRPRCHK